MMSGKSETKIKLQGKTKIHQGALVAHAAWELTIAREDTSREVPAEKDAAGDAAKVAAMSLTIVRGDAKNLQSSLRHN